MQRQRVLTWKPILSATLVIALTLPMVAERADAETGPVVVNVQAKTADGYAYSEATWTNQAVTVEGECQGGSAPIVFCSAAQTFTTDGQHVAEFLAVDSAGNTSGIVTFDVYIDTTDPTHVPESKADCKKGGWRDLSDDVGVPFRNQGDCVSYIATGGSNPAGA